MTLYEMKQKVLRLIEELNPESALLTDDPDIAAKLNSVINQILFELTRFKKLSKYIALPVHAGEVVDFARLEKECGSEIYQIGGVTGVSFVPRANGSVLKFMEDGVAEIDAFVYPERITEKTSDKGYAFEVSADVLEIMPYGIAADLLKSDVSAQYGAVYAKRYETMISQLDPRYQLMSISVEGGVAV